MLYTLKTLRATVKAARAANQVAISLRAQGMPAYARQARENAKGHMRSARNIKFTLSARGAL